MTAVRVLAIDACSRVCSVALWQARAGSPGHLVARAEDAPRQHIKRLLPMMDAVLEEAGVSLDEVDALAYGNGPGSFTGLRIAAGFAQGLAFGANKPLLGVSTLQALALQAVGQEHPQGQVCAALDARMGEIYTASFDIDIHGLDTDYGALPQVTPLDTERVIAPEALALPEGRFSAIGAGFGLVESMSAELVAQMDSITDSAEPNAREIALLAATQWLQGEARPAAEVQPVYLRDNVAKRSTRGPLG